VSYGRRSAANPAGCFLFVATLGYSRRIYVQAFRHERQWAWFSGMEGAFRHFGGLPEEVLFDNAKALVDRHDRATREVIFNQRLHAFARYWGFRPHACAPYRARTKGKDERGRLREAQRNRWACVRQLGGIGGSPGMVDA
jgi:transposase